MNMYDICLFFGISLDLLQLCLRRNYIKFMRVCFFYSLSHTQYAKKRNFESLQFLTQQMLRNMKLCSDQIRAHPSSCIYLLYITFMISNAHRHEIFLGMYSV